MTVTRLAVIGGVAVLGIVCWLAAIGFSAATEGLVTVFALVVLVAGGNLLAGRSAPSRRAPVAVGSAGLDGEVEGEDAGGDVGEAEDAQLSGRSQPPPDREHPQGESQGT